MGKSIFRPLLQFPVKKLLSRIDDDDDDEVEKRRQFKRGSLPYL